MADNFGSVNAADAGTLALLYGGGFGRGIGVGYGGGYGIANPTATFNAVNRNAMDIASQNDFTRELAQSDIEGIRNSFDMLATANEFQTTRKEMTDGFANIANSNLQKTIMDGQSALGNERRQSDLFMNLNNKLESMARDNADCCCDIKLKILEHDAKEAQRFADQTAIIQANDKAAILRDLADAKDSAQTAKIELYIKENSNGAAPLNCL
jgi:hypothetical protein